MLHSRQVGRSWPSTAAVEDVDYRTVRGLDRALLQKLALGGWIKEQQNLIIDHPPIPVDRRQRRTWLLTANLISLRVEAVHQVGQRADQVFAESVAEASVNPDPQATP